MWTELYSWSYLQKKKTKQKKHRIVKVEKKTTKKKTRYDVEKKCKTYRESHRGYEGKEEGNHFLWLAVMEMYINIK